MEVPPKKRKLFNSGNLKGLHEFASDKPLLKKTGKVFFITTLLTCP